MSDLAISDIVEQLKKLQDTVEELELRRNSTEGAKSSDEPDCTDESGSRIRQAYDKISQTREDFFDIKLRLIEEFDEQSTWNCHGDEEETSKLQAKYLADLDKMLELHAKHIRQLDKTAISRVDDECNGNDYDSGEEFDRYERTIGEPCEYCDVAKVEHFYDKGGYSMSRCKCGEFGLQSQVQIDRAEAVATGVHMEDYHGWQCE